MGAFGTFGRLIADALAHTTDLPIIAAGRHLPEVQEEWRPGVRSLAVDSTALSAALLKKLDPAVLIDTVGPFQTRDRKLAEACISLGIHYLDLADGRTHTAIGQGLFDFGLRDGAADEALLQHPLGVTALPDGSIAISDTYNGAIRRYDPATRTVSTLITGLLEPSDAIVVDGDLLVVESAAHRLTRVRLPEAAVRTAPAAYRTQRPATDLAPGELDLQVLFDPPPGQKLDERYGPATRLVVSSSPPELLIKGEGKETGLSRTLYLDPAIESGVLHIAAMAASCDIPPDSAAGDEDFFPACHMHQQDWGIPIRLVAGAPSELHLPLRATD